MQATIPIRAVNNSIDYLSKVNLLIDFGVQCADEVACGIATNLQDENDSDIKKLESLALELCTLQNDIDRFIKASKYVVSEAQRNQEMTDLDSILNKKLMELERKDCRKHPLYVNMVEHIRSRIETDDGDLSTSSRQVQQPAQMDEELAVTEAEINTKCPVTQQEMKNPVRNSHCGHNYDLHGAKELIKNRPTARCPVAGCKNRGILRLEDLVDNNELKRYIEKRNRKMAKK